MVAQVDEWAKVETLPLLSQRSLDLVVARLADDSPLSVPVKVFVGSRHRPLLVAIAGVHGDEPEGMLALLDFAACCDPLRLSGSIVLVPVANPPAFAAHQRRSPLDGLDLNRTFPGSPDGSPTERLAYRLMDDIVGGADFVFTLHSWYATGTVVSHVEVPDGGGEVARRSLAAAVAAGFTRIRPWAWPRGLLGQAAAGLGIPVMEAEIGGQGMSTPENRAAYVDHLTRLLRHLGMLEGSPPPPAAVEVLGRGFVYAPTGGMLRLHVSPGEHVETGAVLATITNLHGEWLLDIRAPHDGLVAAVRRFVSVNPGELVFALYPRLSQGGTDGAGETNAASCSITPSPSVSEEPCGRMVPSLYNRAVRCRSS